MPIYIYRLNTKIRLTMLCLSGFELYSCWVLPLKLPNCPLKQQPHILQLSEALSSVFCLFEEQEQAFVGVLPLPLIFDLQEGSKPSANKSNTRYSLAKSITGRIKFTKRTELWIDFWQLYDIFEPLVTTNSLYGKRTVGFFSLASHARRACEARALRVRESLTLLLDPVYMEWGTPV